MTMLLQRVQSTNEVRFQKVGKATQFRGVIFPVNPTALPTSVFILPRIGLRTRPREPVKLRDVFRDPAGRVLLAGRWDLPISVDQVTSRCYVLFQMTRLVSWHRRAETIDSVTKQRVSLGQPVELGPIWISDESYTHGNEDPGLRIPTSRLRFITGADIQLGDVLDGKTVKRLQLTLGISIAEVE